METQPKVQLLRVTSMARLLGISPGWLRLEAKAGRLPCIDAGGTLLFDADAVQAALAERAHPCDRLVMGGVA